MRCLNLPECLSSIPKSFAKLCQMGCAAVQAGTAAAEWWTPRLYHSFQEFICHAGTDCNALRFEEYGAKGAPDAHLELYFVLLCLNFFCTGASRRVTGTLVSPLLLCTMFCTSAPPTLTGVASWWAALKQSAAAFTSSTVLIVLLIGTLVLVPHT